jgi:hypothetical protein
MKAPSVSGVVAKAAMVAAQAEKVYSSFAGKITTSPVFDRWADNADGTIGDARVKFTLAQLIPVGDGNYNAIYWNVTMTVDAEDFPYTKNSRITVIGEPKEFMDVWDGRDILGRNLMALDIV